MHNLVDKIKYLSSLEDNKYKINIKIIKKLIKLLHDNISSLSDIKIKTTWDEYKTINLYINKNSLFIEEHIQYTSQFYPPIIRKFNLSINQLSVKYKLELIIKDMMLVLDQHISSKILALELNFSKTT